MNVKKTKSSKKIVLKITMSMTNHWNFHSVGQVGTRLLRWNPKTEDFQEECHHIPEIVQDKFQSVQGQLVSGRSCVLQ